MDVKTNYLKYDNMKVVTNMFAPYDDKNIIKETVRSEVVANWEDYVDEFPVGHSPPLVFLIILTLLLLHRTTGSLF